MTTTNSRNEEVKRRVLQWEKSITRSWKILVGRSGYRVEAMQNIMCLTQAVADEYLTYLES